MCGCQSFVVCIGEGNQSTWRKPPILDGQLLLSHVTMLDGTRAIEMKASMLITAIQALKWGLQWFTMFFLFPSQECGLWVFDEHPDSVELRGFQGAPKIFGA